MVTKFRNYMDLEMVNLADYNNELVNGKTIFHPTILKQMETNF